MGKPKTIWKHESRVAERMARSLLESHAGNLPWWKLIRPSMLAAYLGFRRDLRMTRKNLLFTKKLALEAAKEVIEEGKDRALALGSIEQRTRDLLDGERRGLYTEKVRRKQHVEIEILLEHYLMLLRADGRRLKDLVRARYPDRKSYLRYLDHLLEAEQEVIQASISTVRKGSKQERARWFRRVSELSKDLRREEAERFYPEDPDRGKAPAKTLS